MPRAPSAEFRSNQAVMNPNEFQAVMHTNQKRAAPAKCLQKPCLIAEHSPYRLGAADLDRHGPFDTVQRLRDAVVDRQAVSRRLVQWQLVV